LSGVSADFVQDMNNSRCCQTLYKIFIKECSFINTFYNINDKGYNTENSGNNRFIFLLNGVPTTVTVKVGNYDIDTLLAEITLALPFLTGVVDPLLGKVIFTSTIPITFLGPDQNPMAYALGITTGSGGDVTTFEAPSVPNLTGVNHVFVQSRALSDGSSFLTNDAKQAPVILVVNVDVSFGQMQHWRSNDAQQDTINYPSIKAGKNVQNLDIKVVDEFGNVLDLQEHEFQLIINMFHNSNN